MSTAVAWLGLVLVLLVGGFCPSQADSGKPDYQAYESVPTRSFWISVERSAAKQFHEQLEQFSKRNGMGIWKSVTSPDQQNFSIAMQGDQLQIITVNDARLYEVAVYPKKGKPISQPDLDAFITDMKVNLGSIAGVAFPAFAERPYPK